ncbi:MAG: rRNA maturation RNase YbeY [Flavobacteriaceae bacterium]
MISFDSQNSFELSRPEHWELWLNTVVEQEGYAVGDLGYVFCDDNFLLKINQEFLNHDTFTDIITFGGNVGKTVNGEIYLSTERVMDNSKTYGVSFDLELSRVMVHGVLHLCGYDDKTDQEALKMRAREDYWLESLNN